MGSGTYTIVHMVLWGMFTIANLFAVGYSIFLLVTTKGYGGIYQFHDDYSGETVFKANEFYTAGTGQLCNIMPQVCGTYADCTAFKGTYPAFAGDMNGFSTKTLRYDAGNPVDSEMYGVPDSNGFMLCIKGRDNEKHMIDSMCTEVDHIASDNDHGTLTKTRQALMGIAIAGSIFFLWQIIWLVIVMKIHHGQVVQAEKDMNSAKEQQHRNVLLQIAGYQYDEIDASTSNFLNYKTEAYFQLALHWIMYITTIGLTITFFVYSSPDKPADEYNSKLFKSYNKEDACFDDPYAPAILLGLKNMQESHGTEKNLKVTANAIFGTYMAMAVVSFAGTMAIYIQSRKVHKEQIGDMGGDTKEFSDGQTDIPGENDEIALTNIGGYTDNLYRRGRGIMKITF
jgi:hypothetical protein